MTEFAARGLRSLLALAALPLAIGCSSGVDAASTDDGDLDAGSRAETSAPASCAAKGTGAVAVPGCACSALAERACAGNAQTASLTCSGGVWTIAEQCYGNQVCDTIAGADQGNCTPIDPYCETLTSGQSLCVDVRTLMHCNADLTTHTLTHCANQACVTDACTGVCAPGTSQCSDGGAQICGDDGTWSPGSPCTGQACVNGACVGVCTPGLSECDDAGVETHLREDGASRNRH
jgi:hypothetical protein